MGRKLSTLTLFACTLCFVGSVVYAYYGVFIEGFDVVKEMYWYSGVFGLLFLHASMSFSLSASFLSSVCCKKASWFFGMYGALWAFAHAGVFFAFGKDWSVYRVWQELKPFEIYGAIACGIVLLMFLGSFRLFAWLGFCRKLFIVAVMFGSYHYFLSAKVPSLWEYTALAMSGLYALCVLWGVLLKKKNAR